ncbi:MAG: hypothetical protein JO311_08330 [Candidatus Eremiobacteraeota bacterium]|nr:hypothetical protein [Candidatus Eremiobacteraeota bacterium]MBV9233463.1 hypothetical protein [Candidatus Eremiobacteraeota bacterium]
MTVKLNAQNGSGENGSATLTDTMGGITVVISLSGAPSSAQPAHVHDGTCGDLKGVAYALKDVVNGSSTTVLQGTTVAALTAKPYAINVHESASNLGKYVACGDVTASSSM